MALYQLRNYQRFSDQSATNCKRKVHYFWRKVFVFYILQGSQFIYFDSHSRNSVGFQTASGASVLLSFLSYDHLSAYIHRCYICNVGEVVIATESLQHEIEFVKVSTTRQFVSESLK